MRRTLHVVVALTMVTGLMTQLPMQAAQAAPTNTLTINVVSARTEPLAPDGSGDAPVQEGDPVDSFKWIINVDNTATTEQRNADPGSGCSPQDPGYPDSCHWLSTSGIPSSSPVAQDVDGNWAIGTEADIAGGIDLPNGRYLISVLADGHKLDGAHFTIPLPDTTPVDVPLQPTPLPTSTVRAQVFADTLTNGAYDDTEPVLSGFKGLLADVLGQVSTDAYGNPLCTTYETDPAGPNGFKWVDGGPVVVQVGNGCYSDANGVVTIPNLGTDRYTLSVIAPDGQKWIQTTTLEGNHDWDVWPMEGDTGLDTEFAVAAEPVPIAIFGFVPEPTATMNGTGLPASGYSTTPGTCGSFTANCWRAPALPGGTGSIKGVIDAVKYYTPQYDDAMGGIGVHQGGKLAGPIDRPWVVIDSMDLNDSAVWIGRGDANGMFEVPNMPPGNYTITWWDEPQDYILMVKNVTVGEGAAPFTGETVDLGVMALSGWWTYYSGYVFNDTNRNAVRDPGEPGVPNFTLTLRSRNNTLADRGTNTATTDQNGFYEFESGYPFTTWVVMEAYSDLYFTTGVTYQADNQPEPTTILDPGVDLNTTSVIGQSGTVDWGVHAYDATGATGGLDPRNGGIVGTVSYDTTRNELDPRYAAVEDWQPGVSGQTVELYQPVDCPGDGSVPCDADGSYALDPATGGYEFGPLLNTYVTETWEQPSGCVARDADGNPLEFGIDQASLPYDPSSPETGYQDQAARCLDSYMYGVQFGNNFGASVDGNYGFGDGCFNGTVIADDPSTPACDGGDFTPLTAGDYLVRVVPQEDESGNPLYRFTREEDINIGNGDALIPQAVPPACAGDLHQVDVSDGTDNYPATTLPDPSGEGGPDIGVPASSPTENATFVDIGGSPYEGMAKPLCDVKLVPLNNGRSIVPTFNVFTDVPLPARLWEYMIDDLNFSADLKSTMYGEKAGVAFAPVGIYDYTNRLITTVETDYNGFVDVLLPSTNRIICPTPSGVCQNVYRFVGNDPGVPGALNPNFNPQFRTIAAQFEAVPGGLIPADNAPTQVGVWLNLPGSQTQRSVTCPVNDPAGAATTPELYRVSKPYVDTRLGDQTFTIDGNGFGASPGQVLLDGTAMPIVSWGASHLEVTVPATTPSGPKQLTVVSAGGARTINGLTFHVLGFNAFSGSTLLDNFNRGNSGNLGNAWAVDFTSDAGSSVNTQSLLATGSVNARWVSSNGGGPTFGPNQEAEVTFTQVSTNTTTATEQGLYLKLTQTNGNNPDPNSSNSRWIKVVYDRSASAVRVITRRTSGGGVVTTQATFSSVTFGANDRLGARALEDGTVIAYKNGVQIGTVNVATTGNPWPYSNGGGRLGLRVQGATSTQPMRLDTFRGGNVTGYTPLVYEVGTAPEVTPGPRHFIATQFDEANPPHTIQDAIDDAVSNPQDDLIVIYPGPSTANPRLNPRGAYYENLIITAPVKLQGVGPGSPDGTVRGSILDGSAFAGDSQLTTEWADKISTFLDGDGTPSWVGNPDISTGQVLYFLAMSNNAYDSAYRAGVDGFDIRGGDQQGLPGELGEIGGDIALTQGGAIFANAYIRNLQVTNNIVEQNGGAYGTIRVGTPHLTPADNQNDALRVAHNRIVANAGTNLGGAIAIFAGAENYEIDHNDICGNYSTEYGGGISAYGLSPGGHIHDNRIYYNQAFDEAGGVMIAGQLPANATALSPGSGSVTIDGNVILGNLGGDDGGGIRFLNAGTGQMNVFNNMVVDNVSAHEGGGISLNDAPNVRIYNNTIAENITTATASTSNGSPAGAGLSTSRHSTALQNSLPAGSPVFSNPLLFNNVFWHNRAGTNDFAAGMVRGIGLAGDASPINYWDMGGEDPSFLLSPTNSMLQVTTGTIASPTNQVGVDPSFADPYVVSVTLNAWRQNPAFVGAHIVGQDLPPSLLGDFHLAAGSPAINAGAASKSGVNAPTSDIDGQLRPSAPTCAATAAFDEGADEVVSAGCPADLSITKTDGSTNAVAGAAVSYTIVASNAGPGTAVGATVVDNLPAALSAASWTCTATAGSTCPATGSGNISASVNLLPGGSATFVLGATLSGAASGSIANTATITVPGGVSDPNPSNNSATDTDTILGQANLGITKTDGVTSVVTGDGVTYTIVASNAGPSAVTNAPVTDSVPAGLIGGTWACSASAGSSCTAGGSGNLNGTASMLTGGTATFTRTFTVTARFGTISNSATIGVPAGMTDPSPANNTSAPDTDLVLPPTLALLDNFNRANANGLGANWSQANTGAAIDLRVNGNQVVANQLNDGGMAIWNAPVFASDQAASIQLTSNTSGNRDETSLILKANGGTAASPVNYIRVRFDTQGTDGVYVETTTNAGLSFTQHADLNENLSDNEVLFAAAYSDGVVAVYSIRGATTTFLGSVQLPTTGGDSWTTGTGQIGIRLGHVGSTADTFRGGSL
ncbi:MAG: SdrD B-like domain-containing protein [Actinomycetota bacterium]